MAAVRVGRAGVAIVWEAFVLIVLGDSHCHGFATKHTHISIGDEEAGLRFGWSQHSRHALL